jgi:carboxypeptidase Taq
VKPVPAGPAYGELETRFSRLALLEDAAGVLQWDMETMMPPGGAAGRIEQLAVLETVRHREITDPLLAGLLDRARGEDDPDPWRRANLREMSRAWTHANALSPDLVKALATAAASCQLAWRTARAEDDFAALAPQLEALVGLVRETAAAKAEVLGGSPYEALLDEYEPGIGVADFDRLFADLESFLPGFLEKVLARQESETVPEPLSGTFPKDAQRRLAVRLMEGLGFDFDAGRLDVSDHPFCGGTPDDVRITTRYDSSDFSSGLMGVLHETGHALYERGLPRAWRHQPVGRARSAGVHESQSLLVEMQICRGRGFLGFAAPLLRQTFNGAGAAWEADNLYRLYTWVEPGLIRVDADEVTYPAHVIMRYRLEKALIEGGLEVADLPGAWNEAMEKALGRRPPNDRLGCLQDIHWPSGAFGYFPSYTLGAVMAAQLFEAALRAEPMIEPGLTKGDFTPLLGWLREHVHGLGALLPTNELIARATGRGIDTAAYKRHLERRYLA